MKFNLICKTCGKNYESFHESSDACSDRCFQEYKFKRVTQHGSECGESAAAKAVVHGRWNMNDVNKMRFTDMEKEFFKKYLAWYKKQLTESK